MKKASAEILECVCSSFIRTHHTFCHSHSCPIFPLFLYLYETEPCSFVHFSTDIISFCPVHYIFLDVSYNPFAISLSRCFEVFKSIQSPYIPIDRWSFFWFQINSSFLSYAFLMGHITLPKYPVFQVTLHLPEVTVGCKDKVCFIL